VAQVWTALYAIIGLACARTFGALPLAQPRAFYIFAIQAILNLAWAPIFFGPASFPPPPPSSFFVTFRPR
jgi:tryptophan-rich sensory protein